MEHAVLGAGAVGGLVGTAVASLGEGVIVLVRRESLPDYPANLSVERPSGAITAPTKKWSQSWELNRREGCLGPGPL